MTVSLLEMQMRFDKYLDSLYPECWVGGHEYTTSRVLYKIDKITYEALFNSYIVKNDYVKLINNQVVLIPTQFKAKE